MDSGHGSKAARSGFFLPGAGADPFWSEPESAPGPRTSRAGAAQKSGDSATLPKTGDRSPNPYVLGI